VAEQMCLLYEYRVFSQSPENHYALLDMNRLSSYLVLLLALATLCAGLPLARRDLDCSNPNGIRKSIELDTVAIEHSLTH
jgi:hypothetical protein